MIVITYLRDKQKIIESKYHQAAKRFESKYESIHQKVTSRFHRGSIETELIRSRVNKLITKSNSHFESKNISKRFIPIISRTSTKKTYRFHPDIIDWIQGRLSGQTIKIVVREGKIIEKVLLSPKGHKISVKRLDLGLLLRPTPILQIKIRLQLRSIPVIQSGLRLFDMHGV
tara:strand:+ start:71 stop:586 length:516 start_codon:yes stop_codon:yes gene_type:complete